MMKNDDEQPELLRILKTKSLKVLIDVRHSSTIQVYIEIMIFTASSEREENRIVGSKVIIMPDCIVKKLPGKVPACSSFI